MELSGKKGDLTLVPGAGKHSGGGGAVLLPAVMQTLRDRNLAFEEINVGSLVVKL